MDNNQNISADSGRKIPQKKSLWQKTLRVFAWITGIVVSLILIIFCTISWILTPSVLTPLVEKTVNENITGEFRIKRAELFVWSTFPQLKVEVDSISIINHSLDSISLSHKLPVRSDSLLKIGFFSGAVNIPALLIGKISIHDAVLSSTKVNLVTYGNELSNFDIFPQSESEKDSIAGPLSLPDISINRFSISDSLIVRYISIADSTDISLMVNAPEMLTEESGKYGLRLASNTGLSIAPDIKLDSIAVGMDGDINWDHKKPLEVEIEDFNINIGPLYTNTTATFNFNEPAHISSLRTAVPQLKVMDMLTLVPDEYSEAVDGLNTDMEISAEIILSQPYYLNDTLLPSANVQLDIPDCFIEYNGYRANEFALNANAGIDGKDLNLSTVNISAFHTSMDGAQVDFNGTFNELLVNPYINGKIKAFADLSELPGSIKNDIPGTIKGKISLDAMARLHQSDLNVKNFHKIFLNGTLTLDDINISLPDLGMGLYTRSTVAELGTNNKFVSDASRIDSLLTASLKIDTISMNTEGIALQGKTIRAGIGCSNKGVPRDTMTIIPVGATIHAGELTYNSDDTTMMKLRDTYVFAALSRYNDNSHSPLVKFRAGMKGAFYADKTNRLLLKNGSMDLDAHIRPIGRLEKRLKARYDSIEAANPDLSRDSLLTIYKKTFKSQNVNAEYLDIGLDNTTKRILLKWNLSGDIKAESGMMFTPYFPLRNRISNFNLTFSSDSIILKNIYYKIGHSDFLINGEIRNLRHAIAFRRPVEMALHLTSDSINVNELVQASYKGAAFAESIADGSVSLADIESDAELDSLAIQVSSTDQTAALLVPVNISAEMTMDARNIIYSNMLMHKFNGEMLIGNGAVNLRNLSASSPIGNARISALYSAPDKRDIRFGFGLLLDNIDVKQFIGLMPAVDSLMPLLNSFEGKINADIAATTSVDSMMNLVIPSLEAAVKLSGDSLVLLDAETFRTVSKWLLFKNKNQNVIPHMAAEMLIQDSKIELFPFVFDFDRYRLAVMGSNDLAMNFKYHISVLKSPVPFKFGINLSGNTDKMKVRLGGAKYKPGKSMETIAIVDTARINLLREMDNVFRRGSRKARLGALKITDRPDTVDFNEVNDSISHSDSLMFIKEGLIEQPDTIITVKDDNRGKRNK